MVRYQLVAGPDMHIHKVDLHRFKQFKDKTIEFKDGLTLITGANNSGKSSILQALGTWQFCKTLVEIEKGRKGWLETSTKSGVGLSNVDFTPIQVPTLKHLWTNLKTAKVNEQDGCQRRSKTRPFGGVKVGHFENVVLEPSFS